MLRDKLQRVTPPLQLVSQFFEKEPITIRHNQNAANIFKCSAGLKYNHIARRKTSCVWPLVCSVNIFCMSNQCRIKQLKRYVCTQYRTIQDSTFLLLNISPFWLKMYIFPTTEFTMQKITLTFLN